jgi:hypothetical protein
MRTCYSRRPEDATIAGAAHAKGAAASERLIAAGQSAFKGGVPLIQETAL